MSNTNIYLGKGITFPLQLTNGKVVAETSKELIKSSIITILGWPLETRYFLPEFGSSLHKLIGQKNNDIAKALVIDFVVESINRWETRINLLQISITDVTDDKINVYLRYEIINEKVEDSFIYPFNRKITT